MSKLSCNILALAALLVALPAGAQTLSALTLDSDTIQGGRTTTARVVLTAPAGPNGVDCVVFTLDPSFVTLPERISVPTGHTTAAFQVQTLPMDSSASTFLAVYLNETTQWARLNVLQGPVGHTRFALFRSASAQWLLRESGTGSTTTVEFGQPGDQPLPSDYLNGDGCTQLAVFRRGTQEWLIRGHDGTTTTIQFGQEGDVPAPADYLKIGRAQIAVLRPSTKQLRIRTDAGETITVDAPYVQPGDQPVSGNYLGLDHGQFALFRPSTYEWLIRNDDGSATTFQFGLPGDAPAPADYLGLGRAQIAVFRRSTGEWFIRTDDGGSIRVPFGGPGDVPVQGDYLGLGRALIAVFRSDTQEWLIRTDTGDTVRIPFGAVGDEPVPNFYAPHFGLTGVGDR